MKNPIAALALILAACATTPSEEMEAPASGPCNAGRLGDLVGRASSAGLGAQALRRSGSRRLRWIRPGDAVTMDYSAERLNVHLDAQDRVARFACG